jgi:hypothetical protein
MISPLGGLSFMFSLVLILIGFIISGIKKIVPLPKAHRLLAHDNIIISLVIMSGIVTVYIMLYGAAIEHIFHGKNNVSKLYYGTRTCTPLSPKNTEGEKKILLRLDDVQANAWSDISIAMLTAARERGIPVVAGVIPYRIGDDWSIERYFREFGCTTEVAVHGYRHGTTRDGEHTDQEFAHITSGNATARLKAGSEALRAAGMRPSETFIPPTNLVSPGATDAIYNFGFKIISGEDKNTYGFDIDIRPYIINATTSLELALGTCDIRWNAGDPLCVVMMHPQDLSTEKGALDHDLLSRYVTFLDLVVAREDVVTTTFAELPRPTTTVSSR